MRADPSAHRDSEAPPFHSESINHNQTLHRFNAVSDQPIKRATIETRTPKEEARDVGGAVLERLRQSPQWAEAELTPTAQLILMSLCYERGIVQPYSAGLIVHDRIKDIAASLRLTERSAYRPMRELEEAGVIRRMRSNGNRPDAYEVVMPPPGPEEAEGARATSDTAAQGARAISDMSLLSDTNPACKPRTEHELARATSAMSLLSDTAKNRNAVFLDENAAASLVARAVAPPTINTTAITVVGAGEDAAADELEQITEELKGAGLFPNVIPQLAQKTSLWLALAVRFEVAGKKTPGRLANWILSQPNPETCINPPARARADREIQKRRGSTAEPITAADSTHAQQQAIEQRVTELIRTQPTLLATARQRAAEMAVLGSSRENILTTSEPQKNPLIRSVVKEIIAQEFAPAAPSA